MYNGGKIILGLIIFVALVTAPFWLSGEKATAKPDPKVDTPEILKLPESERTCVESKAYMKKEHMKMLNEWRDLVVRDGLTVYASNATGKQYTISLQNTCMKCHSNKKNFCDECHNYAAVKPYCWDCHIEPKEKQI
ncbi:MAG: sulfate reduction electron transfer complex DsrMKJOP subunit DsrJ [Nitrospirota bacterium]